MRQTLWDSPEPAPPAAVLVQRPQSRAFPSLWHLAIVALCLTTLSATASLLNNNSWNSGGVTILWPSNGFLIGVLLCSTRRQWPAWILTGYLIDFALNRLLGNTFGTSAWFSLCNMLEVVVASFPLSRSISPGPDLTRPRQLINFLLYGVLLAPAVASFAVLLPTQGTASFNGSRLHRFLWWFIADALGISIVTPLYLSFRLKDKLQGRSWLEVLGLSVMLVSVTAAVFRESRYPGVYLILPFLLLMGVRLGLAGSACGLLFVSVIAGFLTTSGHGPFMLMRSSSLAMRDLGLQIFIAVSMLVVYIPEVVLAQRRRLQENLITSEARFRLLAEASRDMIVLTDLDGRRHYVSPSVTEVLGWQPDEVLEGSYRDLVHPDDVASLSQLLKECQEGIPPRVLPYRCRNKEGEYRWLETNPRLYRDPSTGHPAGFVNVVRDITDRRRNEDKLNEAFHLVESLASVDGLTGLANRRRFDEILEQEWLRAQRDQAALSLFMIDVDHFKLYNDLYGHLAGDDCLRQIAHSVRGLVNRPADLSARYGGEEFAVILPGTGQSGAIEIAMRICRAIEQLRIPHADCPWGIVTLSIGVATCFPANEQEHSLLVQAADAALYRAKRSGRNRAETAA
jgi:diguanylate cyclase (GGDEF)-like protein/PAS domain S-box-containing protein